MRLRRANYGMASHGIMMIEHSRDFIPPGARRGVKRLQKCTATSAASGLLHDPLLRSLKFGVDFEFYVKRPLL